MPIRSAVAAIALLAATVAGCSSTGSTDTGITFTPQPTAPTDTAVAGYLNTDQLDTSVQETYQAKVNKIDSTVTVTATCVPKPEPRTFTCLIELSTGDTTSHEVIVDPSGGSWVTSN